MRWTTTTTSTTSSSIMTSTVWMIVLSTISNPSSLSVMGFSIGSRSIPLLLKVDLNYKSLTRCYSEPPPKKKDEYDDWYADFNPSDFAWADATTKGTRSTTTGTSDRSITRTGTSDRRPFSDTRYGDTRNGDTRNGDTRSTSSDTRGRTFQNSRSSSSSSSSSRHDYSRDPSDNSQVNEAVVHQLITDRLNARKTGQFDQADNIRDILFNDHGVTVWDKDLIWKSGATTTSNNNYNNNNRGNPRNNYNNNNDNNNQRGGKTRRQTSFGPNGHDYELSYEAGPNQSNLNEPDIHRKIADRLQCKMSRDFQGADNIQDELISAGVYVHDGRKEWRADGQGFGDFPGTAGKPGRDAGSRNDRNRPYEKSSFSMDTNDATIIQDLVEERIAAKRAKDFDTADAIRDELLEDYDVIVNDRTREWSVGGNFGEAKTDSDRDRPYDMSPHSLNVGDDLSTIRNLVAQRSKAKKTRDFNAADSIRDELQNVYNVEIDDRQRLWSAGGDFGFDPNDRRGGEQTPFFMAPGSERPDNPNYIQAQVEAREQARKERNFSLADDIRDELMDEYNVMVDDKLRQWAVSGMFGGRKASGPGDPFVRRGGGNLSQEDVNTIAEWIRNRNDAKRDKNFGKADRIRDQLRDEYSVSVDDRSREWMVVSDDYSMSSGSGDMEEDVKAYIVSKISERSVAKLNKDYNVADAIRDELYEEYNVQIDDRVREWMVEGPMRTNSRYEGEYSSSDNVEYSSSDDDDEKEWALSNGVAELESDDENLDVVVDQSVELDNDSDNLESLTVVELKERLRLAGMPVSGKKSELIQRLTGA